MKITVSVEINQPTSVQVNIEPGGLYAGVPVTATAAPTPGTAITAITAQEKLDAKNRAEAEFALGHLLQPRED